MHRTPSYLSGATALAACLTLAAAPALAQTDATGGAPGSWLMNYAGARTLGLGGAFVATADDALGMLWNPAGLQRMDQNELMFENVRLFEDTSINSFGFAVPGSWLPSFGLSMVSLGSGEFQRTNEMNDDLGSFRDTETAYLFTLAKGLSPRLAVGTNLKLVQQSVENFSAGGYGFDVGAIWQALPSNPRPVTPTPVAVGPRPPEPDTKITPEPDIKSKPIEPVVKPKPPEPEPRCYGAEGTPSMRRSGPCWPPSRASRC